MLQPKKTKYAKWQRGKSKGVASRGNELSFGSFGLKSLGTKWVSSYQIEAARMTIIRALKKKGRLWIRIFPFKPITIKGTETGMGGGKGKVEFYAFPVTPGRVLFEIEGVDEEKAREVLRKAATKLPIKTKFIKK